MLVESQKDDPFSSPLLYYLESGNDTHLPCLPVPLLQSDIREEILVHTTYLKLKYEPEREVTQIVIPKSLVPTLHRLHFAPQVGHPG